MTFFGLRDIKKSDPKDEGQTQYIETPEFVEQLPLNIAKRCFSPINPPNNAELKILLDAYKAGQLNAKWQDEFNQAFQNPWMYSKNLEPHLKDLATKAEREKVAAEVRLKNTLRDETESHRTKTQLPCGHWCNQSEFITSRKTIGCARCGAEFECKIIIGKQVNKP